MTTPAEYRAFAVECLRWADETKDASQRQTYTGLARVWMRTAVIVEDVATLTNNVPKLYEELRAKLN
jgi:hypothetical protein